MSHLNPPGPATTGQTAGPATTGPATTGPATTGPACPPAARTTARDRRDLGAATVWVLTIGLVFVIAGLGGAAVGAARVAKHQARTAADLGALAGAAQVFEGEEAACGRAADLVRRNGGRLTRCVVDGLDLIVTAEVKVTPLPGITRTARQDARAGPVRTSAR
ncbi:Rv3654c family TadE-like protein [Phytohabitans aurantiacus]|uniref:Putative Flp pilus-assembly TadG-like N-terminal domain-containing protein n=1 Tax=Phytohabitans aurantiacus TaxID=3016789 RepID=A0ABQ5QUS8_9ACTN|nr:hypothetical protein Pa4123_36100 [Phytohabitans aurantiacus]